MAWMLGCRTRARPRSRERSSIPAGRAVIEPIRRAFVVVAALSWRRASLLPVLFVETGLPRPTVVRLLHTLAACGYAQQISRDQGWRLTDRVLGLAQSIR